MKQTLLLIVMAMGLHAQAATSGILSQWSSWVMVTCRQGNLGWVTTWRVYTTDRRITKATVTVTFKDGTVWTTWAPLRIRARDNQMLLEPEMRVKYEDIQDAEVLLQ